MMIDRTLWYMKHPWTVEIEENQIQSTEFPTVEVCNIMQFSLSKTDAYNFSSASSDLVELIAKLSSQNETVQSEAFEFARKLPKASAKLRHLAKVVQNSKNVTINCHSSFECYERRFDFIKNTNYAYDIDNFSGFNPEFYHAKDQDEFDNIFQSLDGFLLKTYAILLTEDKRKKIESPWGLRAVYAQVTMVKVPHLRKIFLSWKKRLELAADILESIAQTDMVKLSIRTRQSEKDFVIRCSWKNTETCTTVPVAREAMQCFKIKPSQDFSQTSLSFVLNLEQYNNLPGLQSGIAKVYLYKEDAQTEAGFSVQPGQHWFITLKKVTKINRIDRNCQQIQLKYFDNYSQALCTRELNINRTLQVCGCSPSLVWDIATLNKSLFPYQCNISEEFECKNKLAKFHKKSTHHNTACNADCYSVQYETDLTAVNMPRKELVDSLPDNWVQTASRKLFNYTLAASKIDPMLLPYRQKLSSTLNRMWNFMPVMMDRLLVEYSQCGLYTKNGHSFNISSIIVMAENISTTEYINMCSHSTSKGIAPICFLMKEHDRIVAALSEWNQILFVTKTLISDFFSQQMLRGLHVIDLTENQVAELYRSGSFGRHKVEAFIKQIQDTDVYEARTMRFLPDLINTVSQMIEDKDTLLYLPFFKDWNIDDVKMHLMNASACFRMAYNHVQWIQLSDVRVGTWYSDFIQLVDELMVYYPATDYLMANYLKVTVHFEVLWKQQITETTTYNAISLLADFGGTMGLFVGATILFLYEVIVFIISLSKESMIVDKRKTESGWVT